MNRITGYDNTYYRGEIERLSRLAELRAINKLKHRMGPPRKK